MYMDGIPPTLSSPVSIDAWLDPFAWNAYLDDQDQIQKTKKKEGAHTQNNRDKQRVLLAPI